MFHWPFVSAFVGISTNLFFILVISVLSWYHWGDAMWIERRIKQRLASTRQKLQSTRRHRDAGERSVSTMLDEDAKQQRDPHNNSMDAIDDNEDNNELLNDEYSSESDIEADEHDLSDNDASCNTEPILIDNIINVSGRYEESEQKYTKKEPTSKKRLTQKNPD